MSVVKGSEDENREGGMDGSRVVKIFELDAAQGFVGLDWTGSAMALIRRRQEKEDGKKGATSAYGKATKDGGESKNQQREEQQQQ